MKALGLVLILSSFSATAGVKDKFIQAVQNQCDIDQAKALSYATPGRNGTVIRYTLCIQQKQVLSPQCTLTCQKSGAKVGN